VKCVWGNSDFPTPFRVCFNIYVCVEFVCLFVNQNILSITKSKTDLLL
jgi:hypothetical protein